MLRNIWNLSAMNAYVDYYNTLIDSKLFQSRADATIAAFAAQFQYFDKNWMAK